MTRPMLNIQPGIMDIAPYIGGESRAKSDQRVIKLSSNEGALGPSPKAMEAVRQMAGEIHRYPDGDCRELREALATRENIPAEQIICGSGSDEIISLLCQSYAGPGDEIIYTDHGFLMYPISAKANGAVPVSVPETDLKADVDEILKGVTDKTKIVFLANPNNPTGSYISKDKVRRLRKDLPEDILLVIDSAYCEFVEEQDYSAGHELIERYGNVVVTRTFSKIYAMGGLRLGWGHCPPDIIDVLNRVRGPFNVNSVAQAAGIAALEDEEFLARSRAHTSEWRQRTASQLTAMGLTVYPSVANFILVEFGSPERAEACRQFLKNRGILVRQMGAYNLGSCLRISIGLGEEMELACAAVKEYLKQA